ncbi:uncharacterized protein METZ01_LOCUS231576, partial [marine metagenome]
MTSSTTIFAAKKILTMNSYQPIATHVAVRDGRILGVGSLDELAHWGDYTLNETFCDKVLVPGFVEAHCHAMNGSVWEHTYVGYFDRTDPNGQVWPGIKNITGVVERLIEIEQTLDDSEETLFAWGFDPIYFDDGVRMKLEHLDQVSRDRRILVQHSNGHLLNANRKVLELASIDATTDVEGVMKDTDGNPTGELGEMAAQFMAYKVTGMRKLDGINSNDLWSFAKTATNAGVTTATDLHARVEDQNVQAYVEVTKSADYPLRLVPAAAALTMSIQDGPSHVAQLKQ